MKLSEHSCRCTEHQLCSQLLRAFSLSVHPYVPPRGSALTASVAFSLSPALTWCDILSPTFSLIVSLSGCLSPCLFLSRCPSHRATAGVRVMDRLCRFRARRSSQEARINLGGIEHRMRSQLLLLLLIVAPARPGDPHRN